MPPDAAARSGPSLGGIVLAGGEGRRFGRPKAGVDIGGVTLVQRAVDALLPLCARVVVTTRPDLVVEVVGAAVAVDRDGPRCALTGIRTGLSALDTDDVVVLACDLAVDSAVIAALAHGRGAVVTEAGTAGSQPLCARYPRLDAMRAIDELLAGGELRARALPRRLGARSLAVGDEGIVNINTVDDARAVARRRREEEHNAP